MSLKESLAYRFFWLDKIRSRSIVLKHSLIDSKFCSKSLTPGLRFIVCIDCSKRPHHLRPLTEKIYVLFFTLHKKISLFLRSQREISIID